MLSGDTLGDNLGELVHKDFGLSSSLVNSAGSEAKEALGLVGAQLRLGVREGLTKHLFS